MSIALGFLFEEVYPVYHICVPPEFPRRQAEFMERWRQLIFSGWSFSSTSISLLWFSDKFAVYFVGVAPQQLGGGAVGVL
jgi:hypothetical protein